MVDTKDLRIGNFVFDKVTQKNVRVKCLGNSTLTLNLDDGLRGVEQVETIPLKSEWLLHFGFARIYTGMTINNGFEYNRQVVGNEDDVTIIDRDGTWFSACGVYGWEKTKNLGCSVLCRGNYVSNNLMFVHELQNAYYSMTSNELPFKLLVA